MLWSDEAIERTGEPKGYALGFYQASAGHRYSLKADGRGLPTGGVCGVLKAIDVQFGVPRRRILIAREIVDQPCIRQFVEAHERQHVAADEAVLGRYLPRLQAVLADELSGGLGVAAETPVEAKKFSGPRSTGVCSGRFTSSPSCACVHIWRCIGVTTRRPSKRHAVLASGLCLIGRTSMPLMWNVDHTACLITVTAAGLLKHRDFDDYLAAAAADGAAGYRVLFDLRAASLELRASELAAVAEVAAGRTTPLSSGAIAIIVQSDAEHDMGLHFARQLARQRPAAYSPAWTMDAHGSIT